jgi:DNA-binding response OmpR family regulator
LETVVQTNFPDIEPTRIVALVEGIEPKDYAPGTNVCTMGRSKKCQIVVPSDFRIVSKVHAMIERRGTSHILADNHSMNGTFVNRVRIHEPYILEHEDTIGLGSPNPLFQFLDPGADVDTTLPVCHLYYEEKTRSFYLKQQPLDLTPNEWKLLLLLYEHIGAVCERERCAQSVWGHNFAPGMDADALDRVVSNLRKKFRQIDPTTNLIQTRSKMGYQLLPELEV